MARNEFARFKMLMTTVAAMMSAGNQGGVVAPTRAAAIEMAGGYQSRGKRKTKSHSYGGNLRFRRKAAKLRNKVRNRQAHRGSRK